MPINTIFLIHLFLPRQLLKEQEAKDHPLQPRQSFSPSAWQSANQGRDWILKSTVNTIQSCKLAHL